MTDLLITTWYDYIGNILMEAKLIKTIPKLEIVSVKRYKGQIVKRGKIFIKIQISRLDFDTEDNRDIIHVICHEFAHMEHWEHWAEHDILTIEYINIVYKQLAKDNNILLDKKEIIKLNEKEIAKMYEQITVKELVKVLKITIKEMLDIDIILTNGTTLYDLEPLSLVDDNRVLNCITGLYIYLNNVDMIRIFGKDNKIKSEHKVIKNVSNSKPTKKDLEITLLQDLLNTKDAKIGQLIEKIKDLEKTNAELNSSLKKKTKTGRKPYSNEKVIEIIRNLRLEGNGYLEIANRLNSMNLLTDKNKLWGASSIKCIIKRYIEKS